MNYFDIIPEELNDIILFYIVNNMDFYNYKDIWKSGLFNRLSNPIFWREIFYKLNLPIISKGFDQLTLSKMNNYQIYFSFRYRR